ADGDYGAAALHEGDAVGLGRLHILAIGEHALTGKDGLVGICRLEGEIELELLADPRLSQGNAVDRAEDHVHLGLGTAAGGALDLL
ncbi:hypothetical protein PMAYCL1PPCAC_03642, partial [Pristionchus mayeri]